MLLCVVKDAIRYQQHFRERKGYDVTLIITVYIVPWIAVRSTSNTIFLHLWKTSIN
jgi:hypothetical protein